MNKPKSLNFKTPKGVSLIENLLVMSLMSVIFTVSITTLAFLMRVEMKGTTRIHETLNLQKLSHQFREDAGSAQNAVVIPQDNNTSSELQLDMGMEASVIYSGDKEGTLIRRLKKQSDQIVAQNEFRIPVESLQFGMEKINQRVLVSMRFRTEPEETHDNQTVKKPDRTFKVESLIDQKHLFHKRSETAKSN
tara:strand:- start:3083 stop:3658 length:576 start_codon:yes stop_codon:yes gene_type:complete